jgi:hypothetical protein
MKKLKRNSITNMELSNTQFGQQENNIGKNTKKLASLMMNAEIKTEEKINTALTSFGKPLKTECLIHQVPHATLGIETTVTIRTTHNKHSPLEMITMAELSSVLTPNYGAWAQITASTETE